MGSVFVVTVNGAIEFAYQIETWNECERDILALWESGEKNFFAGGNPGEKARVFIDWSRVYAIKIEKVL